LNLPDHVYASDADIRPTAWNLGNRWLPRRMWSLFRACSNGSFGPDSCPSCGHLIGALSA